MRSKPLEMAFYRTIVWLSDLCDLISQLRKIPKWEKLVI
ncbi:hypothetical protein SAMN05421640_2246 [Ekhidna lutea]|uniref:Uncharacterized protein n=1 Tax=Ekhidna lutea TaxID=447679 RepID=A0A239JMT1_EKHLU|nr:hypothetical protein SAMN05421640_2246 [Ekhidna lutea]